MTRSWRQSIKRCNTDDTGNPPTWSSPCLILSAPLSGAPPSPLTHYKKRPNVDELIIEAIQCLEAELGRSDSEREKVEADDGFLHTSITLPPFSWHRETGATAG
jgi:phosphatidylserine decarboxylase